MRANEVFRCFPADLSQQRCCSGGGGGGSSSRWSGSPQRRKGDEPTGLSYKASSLPQHLVIPLRDLPIRRAANEMMEFFGNFVKCDYLR